MNSKTAIKNLSDVPNKFNISGGDISGKTTVNNALISNTLKIRSVQGLEAFGLSITDSSESLTLGWIDRPTIISSHGSPMVKTDSGEYAMYHTGFKPTAIDVGAIPTIGGNVNGSLVYPGSIEDGSDDYAMIKYGTKEILGVEPGDMLRLGGYSASEAMQSIEIYPKATFYKDIFVQPSTVAHKVYHQGFKPTATEIEALPLNGGDITGTLNVMSEGESIISLDTSTKYLELKRGTKIHAWPGWGSGSAQMWYDGNNKTLVMDRVDRVSFNGKKLIIQQSTPTGLGAADAGTVWITW